MKNIHIIPTDKPSRLYKSKITQDVFISDNRSQHGDATYNVNIYITSDEEIKVGDWHFKNDKMVTKSHLIDNTCKKIILTTDQDLIKDDVQAIDDEFLEWFVKNPSCEEVEVKKARGKENSWGYIPIINKIIIPKEEPKQETVGKEFYESVDKVITVSKQETLEEVVERLIKLNRQDAFYEGAKWQQERMYSEEDLLGAFEAGMMFIGEDKGSFKEWFEQLKKK